ncbi:MAG: 30S ribosomal protein S1 [Verrucomicrobiota bacterium]|nr:30S ribosomal protein S1 [Verrucomicrobiota bacterium]
MAAMYEQTLKHFTEGSIVSGKVLEVRKDEVLIDIGYKSEGVVPAGEFQKIAEIKPGDQLDVLLAEIEDENGMVVLSKQKADEKIRWDRVLAKHQEGAVIEGVIRARVKGGLIVDIDGVDAFLPGSQIDVTPVRNMDSYVGGRYEFKVIKINSDRRNIILSRRELIEERLEGKRRELLATIQVGQKRKGRVKNITDFGVFVDLVGLDGLLHITDMSWGRVKHPSDMVTQGQEIEVVILEVDHARERVSLGLKQATPNPWDDIEAKYPVGSRLRGRVVSLAPYGAFVEIEKGVEGLVHVSEISWTRRIGRASDVLSVGQEVDAVVLGINKQEQKIALGIRQTEENPWDTVHGRYPVGSRVTGKVRNFTSYGAFVEMEEGIDGMIHVSDMSWTRKVNHPTEVLEKGQTIEAVVLEVNSEKKHISLGLKQVQEDPWNRIVGNLKVGQVVKGKVTKIASFGAFVEIQDGVDGLVHVSQISENRMEKVSDALKPGQEVEARIVRIEKAERRIGLSIRAVGLPEEEFMRQREDMFDDPKPGEDMVTLAGALDHALGGEEWRPGQRAGDKKPEGPDQDAGPSS